jgi:aryl-alcohol dehydrogenase-like predicted oxidoreductase
MTRRSTNNQFKKISTETEKRVLGTSGIEIPAIGIGTLTWGDKRFGYGKTHTKDDLFEAFQACLDVGLNYFDTSENYGGGMAESLLGEFQKRDGRPIMVGTKFSPATIFEPSARFSPSSVMPTLESSLKRLNRKYVDLYQLHSPPPRRKLDAFLDAFTEAFKSGKARAVGISNFNVELMRYTHDYLKSKGIPLASVENGYNILYRYPETNGVFDACEELDVAYIAYLPLSEGILTGKYRYDGRHLKLIHRVLFWIGQQDFSHLTGEKPLPIFKRLFSVPRQLRLKELEPLFVQLETVAKNHGKTVPQVALNWILKANPRVIPIPGAKNARQAKDNAGALNWRMNQDEFDEIARLEEATR